jgi:hypothetical protein
LPRPSVLALCLSLSLLVPELAFPAPRPLRLRWNELAPLVVAQTVEVVLTDGTRLRGEALAIRDENLVLDWKKASKTKRYSKGNIVVPRSEIAGLTLIRYPGSMGRATGAVTGTLAGMTAGSAILYKADGSFAAVAGYLAASIGGGWAGHRLGKTSTPAKRPSRSSRRGEKNRARRAARPVRLLRG